MPPLNPLPPAHSLLDAEGTPLTLGDEVVALKAEEIRRGVLLKVGDPREGSRYHSERTIMGVTSVLKAQRATQAKADGGVLARRSPEIYRPCLLTTITIQPREGDPFTVRVFLEDRNPSLLKV